MLRFLSAFIFVIVLLTYSNQSWGTAFDFKLTSDGAAITEDAGSDTVVGTNLQPLDTFDYTLLASGTDLWQVDVTKSYFPVLDFQIDESGSRTANIQIDLLLTGGVVFSSLQSGVLNQFVHMGAQGLTLTSGLQFDEMRMTYTFLTSDSLNNTIGEAYFNITGGSGPEGYDGISRIIGRNPVPEPATVALLGIGLVGLAGAEVRRRRKKVKKRL